MKSKRRNRLWAIIGTLVMVLPLFTTLGNAKEVFAADPPAEQNVIINKKQFDTIPANKDNTGDEMNDFGGTALGGAVFTAYDVTTAYWTAYKASTATTDAGKQTDAIAAIVDGNKIKIDVSGAKSFVFGATDATNGQAALKLPTTSGDGTDKQNAVYVFKETTSPAGVNQSKSIPFVLGLPSVEDNGTYRTDVYVYPKNEVKTNNLQFTKYGVDENGNIDKGLAGAKFVLKQKGGNYFNTTTNQFSETAIAGATEFTSAADGKVAVPGLTLAEGDYEFYEVDSDIAKATTPSPSADVYHYKTNPVVTAHVDANMAITYTYYDKNQKQQTTGDPAAYNYKVPAPKKTTPDHDLDKNKTYTYTITQQIPLDVANYTTFSLIDTYNKNLGLAETNEVDNIKVTIDGKTIGTGTDDIKDVAVTKTSDEANHQFTLKFTPSELANYAGQTISFTVDMKITNDADLDANLDNTINFDNNFYPKHDTVNVKTYGKIFEKYDAATGNPLKGAEFVIKNGNKYLKAVNADGSVIPENTTVSAGWVGTWVDDSKDATTFISDENGSFKVNGLQRTDADNTDPINYELVETKAVDGYRLPADSFKFIADGKTDVVQADGKIANKIKGVLPSTGGIGIVAFIAIGAALIAGGVYYFKKRRHNFEA